MGGGLLGDGGEDRKRVKVGWVCNIKHLSPLVIIKQLSTLLSNYNHPRIFTTSLFNHYIPLFLFFLTFPLLKLLLNASFLADKTIICTLLTCFVFE